MPYIKQTDREHYQTDLDSIIDKLKESGFRAGDMNYIMFKIILASWEHNQCYDEFNKIKGVLECVSDEFTRRIVNEYEDKKIAENGDILDNRHKASKERKTAKEWNKEYNVRFLDYSGFDYENLEQEFEHDLMSRLEFLMKTMECLTEEPSTKFFRDYEIECGLS